MTHTGRALRVDLGERSYPIQIETGRLAAMAERWAVEVHPTAALIFTDAQVAPQFLTPVRSALEAAGLRVGVLALPAGETTKDVAFLQRGWDACFEHQLDRSSAIVALGGGVIGDLAGFVAATYLRGIRFLQIPTSLLAQVDSSVGGKTAVNHPRSKNSIGAFYQPCAVLIDPATLRSLPDREYRAGLAEVVKYGVISDAKFFGWLEANVAAILAHDAATLEQLIFECCRLKAWVVGQDETETGLRAILNFGHTFAHAIEATAGYGAVLHGEAVAIGMGLAGRLAADLGLWPAADQRRLIELMRALGLRFGWPLRDKPLATDTLLEAMARDKKSRHGRLRLILPEGMGQVQMHDAIAIEAVRAAWNVPLV